VKESVLWCHHYLQVGVTKTLPLQSINCQRWRGGAMGKAFGLAISRSRVQILLEATLRNNLRQVVYTYLPLSPSNISFYNLVPAKGQWCSVAGEVTAGLGESNGSLPLGGWLTLTCRLTAYIPGSALGPMLGVEYGKPFLLASTAFCVNGQNNYYFFRLTTIFPGEPGSVASALGPPPPHGKYWISFIWAGCPSCHPTITERNRKHKS